MHRIIIKSYHLLKTRAPKQPIPPHWSIMFATRALCKRSVWKGETRHIAASLIHDSAVYWSLYRRPQCRPVRPLFPVLLSWDSSWSCVAIDWLTTAFLYLTVFRSHRPSPRHRARLPSKQMLDLPLFCPRSLGWGLRSIMGRNTRMSSWRSIW